MVEEQREELLVGYDLCDDFTQLYCYDWKTYRAVPVYPSYEEESGLIPTVLFERADTGEWFFGEDALSFEGEGKRIKGFIGKIQAGEGFSGIDEAGLMVLFLRKTLSILKLSHPNGKIKMLVITLKEPGPKIISVLYKALRQIGLNRDRVRIRSHRQCYVYYALSQEKELWSHDIGLFDLRVDKLTYCQIHINRRLLPMTVEVTEKDLTRSLFEGQSLLSFENVAKGILHNQNVSTLYLIGKSFSEKWAQGCIQELCVGRRLFAGQNLYGEGACYYARESVEKGKLADFTLVSDEIIPYSVFLLAYQNACQGEIPLLEAGTPWYDAKAEFDVILDGTDSVSFCIKDRINRPVGRCEMKFYNQKERPRRMTRIQMELFFVDGRTMVIRGRDRGFGAVYPASRRIFEETVQFKEARS